MTERNKPDHVVRDGSLKAAIWKNRSDDGSYYTVTLAKTYKDQDGNLRDTQSFYQSDLLRIAELGRETYGKIRDLRREQSRDHAADDRENFRENRASSAQTREHPRER